MPAQPFSTPVEDSVPKTNEEIAVGENLEFQRKWWKFERIIWSIFVLLILCDVLGLFGRGWLANGKAATEDGSLVLNYERIARASTPSIMTLNFSQAAIHDGRIKVYVSDSVVKPLGAQRIAPQPASSAVGNGGITYDFAATQAPAVVQIALEPSFPGYHHFQIAVDGESHNESLSAGIFVVP